jgi:hypothetical protein
MNEKENAQIAMTTPATEEDCKAGRAIFYIPDNRSKVYDLGRPLPLTARYRQDTDTSTAKDQGVIPAGTVVEIIQCEIGDNGENLVGFRYTGGEGLCMLNELDII